MFLGKDFQGFSCLRVRVFIDKGVQTIGFPIDYL